MTRTRHIFLSLLLAMLASPCPAGEDHSAYCEKQARDITNEIVQKVLPGLDTDQRDRVRTAATQACMHLLTQDPGLMNEAKGSTSTDWFTNYVLHGKPADKAGNKRLRDLKH